MLHIRTTDDNKVVHKCPACMKEYDLFMSKTTCLSRRVINGTGRTSKLPFLDVGVFSDPTLPHLTDIVCPSAECSKKDNVENDIVYMRYDDENMKYVFCCMHCKHIFCT